MRTFPYIWSMIGCTLTIGSFSKECLTKENHELFISMTLEPAQYSLSLIIIGDLDQTE